jgi:small subunit ribosomal protein S9
MEGTGRWSINGRPIEDYFPSATHRMIITEPLRITSTEGRYDILVKIQGGGASGQSGALRHAISRALVNLDPDLRPVLKSAGFLTRDAREKERRKYGLKKARKAPQYSKR